MQRSNQISRQIDDCHAIAVSGISLDVRETFKQTLQFNFSGPKKNETPHHAEDDGFVPHSHSSSLSWRPSVDAPRLAFTSVWRPLFDGGGGGNMIPPPRSPTKPILRTEMTDIRGSNFVVLTHARLQHSIIEVHSAGQKCRCVRVRLRRHKIAQRKNCRREEGCKNKTKKSGGSRARRK